jgi:hypothetical protein
MIKHLQDDVNALTEMISHEHRGKSEGRRASGDTNVRRPRLEASTRRASESPIRASLSPVAYSSWRARLYTTRDHHTRSSHAIITRDHHTRSDTHTERERERERGASNQGSAAGLALVHYSGSPRNWG